jgi:sec-independent protein translocase protein TatA
MSGGELVIVVVAVMVLFGARKIPEFAKGLGQGIKEFKKASTTDDSAEKKPTTPAA